MEKRNQNKVLRQGLDNDILVLDMQDIFRAETQEVKEEDSQPVLEGLQNAVPAS